MSKKHGRGFPFLKLKHSKIFDLTLEKSGMEYWTFSYDVPKDQSSGEEASKTLEEMLNRLEGTVKNKDDTALAIHFQQKTNTKVKGGTWHTHNWGTPLSQWGDWKRVSATAESKMSVTSHLSDKFKSTYRIRVEKVFFTIFTKKGKPLEVEEGALDIIPAFYPRDKYGRFVTEEGKANIKYSKLEWIKFLKKKAKKQARDNRGKFLRLKKPSER